MEKIKINSYQAREMLTQLQTQIREQRQALQNGASGQTLEPYLEAWETMVQHIQTEMMLEKSAQLGLFYEVSRPIYASLDWRQTLQAVLDAFITLTSAERGLLLVLDVDNRPQVEIIRTATILLFPKPTLPTAAASCSRRSKEKVPFLPAMPR